MTLLQQLELMFSKAFMSAEVADQCVALVRPSGRPEFGDYQVNGVMAAAKKMGVPPRNLAQRVIKKAQKMSCIEKMEVAGPGFINIFLKDAWIFDTVLAHVKDDRCGIEQTAHPQRIVVDYSHPNIAKEMAVHHIRSTVIGDAIVRMLLFMGHEVMRQNHIGDWGTQFGMLIAYMEQQCDASGTVDTTSLKDLEIFYKSAKKCFDAHEAFAERARECVVKLQSGDETCLALWKQLVHVSMEQNTQLYQRLNVSMRPEDTMGESAYNADLPDIVSDLKKANLLKKHDEAHVVFLEDFLNKEGQAMGVIIQKRDGGYLYATTDLAALRYRVRTLHADRIIYCVDARQEQHLMQVFSIARKVGYLPDSVTVAHYPFGMMLGQDGKPFKTRSGETVKLGQLLDEAEMRVEKLLADKNTDMTDHERLEAIMVLAIGAIKYADLSKNRRSHYVFDWDLMLQLDGNTAPYLLYAYTRIQSVLKKTSGLPDLGIRMVHTTPQERILALRLLQFGEALNSAVNEGVPHLLCAYLYDVSVCFMSFYEHCPIIRACCDASLKESRLVLCVLTANVLRVGLNLLGIGVIQRM